MRIYVWLFFAHCVLFAEGYNVLVGHKLRSKREAVGALHIITNHAQPIHEDVKPEGANTEKPCPEKSEPSHIEMGTVFQVLPPKDAVWFEGKSLRKSLPLTDTLELVRSVSRVLTLTVLLVSGVLEFYPMIQNLYNILYNLMYP